MTDTDKPFVDLSPERVLCSVHPLPWKETWQEPGTMVAVIKFCMSLFDVLVSDEEFTTRCGAQVEAINTHMPIPLCCWVAAHYPDKLEAAYRALDVEPPDIGAMAQRN